jgi:formyltetrahydrofolate deformylase
VRRQARTDIRNNGCYFFEPAHIVVMKEFVEPVSNTFFARLEISGLLDIAGITAQLEAALPDGTNIQLRPYQKKKVVILVTKEQHCLSDLLVRHHFGEMQANIIGVIGNYDKLRSFTEKLEIPFYHISHEGKDKSEYEGGILRVLEKLSPDLIVLAKYMRILSPAFVQHYPNRIINIHHSFLPAFGRCQSLPPGI